MGGASGGTMAKGMAHFWHGTPLLPAATLALRTPYVRNVMGEPFYRKVKVSWLREHLRVGVPLRPQEAETDTLSVRRRFQIGWQS